MTIQSVSAEYSTTRNLSKVKLPVQSMLNTTSELLVFPPPHSKRLGAGGLRQQGYVKSNGVDGNLLITVLTVVFNAVDSIEDTILSVINQSYDNVEFIIIDGGSTDGTLDVIRKYEHVINYWISEPDGGIYDAMNKGWAVSSSNSSILFMGAGDRLLKLPDHIDGDKIVYGNVRIGQAIKYYPSSNGWRLKIGNTLHHQALLVPKKLHLNPPFNLAYKVYADFDFNQRLYKLGYPFVFNPDFISYAAPDGVSANLNIKEMAKIVLRNFSVFHAFISVVYGTYQVSKIKINKLIN